MASAQISETIRPAYIWTGEEWIQIGDGGSGTGGGGSVVGGTNIDVNYNEELNTFTVSAGEDLVENSQLVHNDHVKVEVAYNEESNKIIITGEGLAKYSYGSASPNFAGEEEEIFYHIDTSQNEVLDRYIYLNGEWVLFSDDGAVWESLTLETWQWLLDTEAFDNWDDFLGYQTSIGSVDFNMRYIPNLIGDIRYLQRNKFGDALITGSTALINSLQSGSPTLNGSIKINRGYENPVEIRWNETLDIWEFTSDGIEYNELGTGNSAVLFQEEQPDVTGLEPGTLWVDSDRPAVNGLMAQTFLRWVKELSASASIFSGNDDNLNPLFYTPEFEQVYLNGTLLVRGDDYTATDGLVITLDEAASLGDVIEIHAFEPFNVTNQYTKNASDAKFATKTELEEIDLSAYVEKSETELVKYGPTEPTSPEEGTIWIDSTNVIKPITKVYNGSEWIIASAQSEAGFTPFFLAGI